MVEGRAREITPGDVLAKKYRLLVCLGRGGMGQVWRAQDLVLGSLCAVKVVEPELLAIDESRQEVVGRFLAEAQAAAALRSPHVVQILEYGLDEGIPFIAMELLVGETLEAKLLRERVLQYAETARVITHVSRAMTRAHEMGIVHRDLKPGNVFLTNDDEPVAKIMDFGIAKKTHGHLSDGGAGMTRTGRIVGTPAYMSPEQMLGKPVDARADLWAIAVVAYECVVGRRPFEGTSQGELTIQVCAQAPPIPSKVTRVPPGFDAWFARAVHREPDRRFTNARDLVEALRAVLLQPNLPPPAAAAPRRSTGETDTERGLVTARRMPAGGRGKMTRAILGVALGTLAGASVLGAFFVRDRFGATPAARADATTRPVEPAAPPITPPAAPAPAPEPVPEPTPAASEAPTATATAAETAAPSAPTEAPSAHHHDATTHARTPAHSGKAPPIGTGRSRDPRLGF